MPSSLFSPLRLRQLILENRIVVSPMCQYASEDGNASDWHMLHLGSLAVSGAGLVITESVGVEPQGRISNRCLGLYSDDNEAALQRVIAACHRYGGAKMGIQLGHAGRKGSVTASFQPRRPLTPEEGWWQPEAPSFLDDAIHSPPEVLDEARMNRIRAAWVDSTRRSHRVGFDLIELHFGHGYLLNQFLSPLTNTRTDAYGGSLEKRMRFPLEIFELCRQAWPEDKPLGVRISAVDWVEGGWTLEDSIAFSQQLKERGCDYVCTTSGGSSMKQQIATGPGYQVPFAEAVRREAQIRSMAVGQITTAAQAEAILAEGRADLIAIARAMLFNPRWAWHAALELGEHIDYPKRYRSCHPAFGRGLKFAESTEQSEAIQRIWALNEERRARQTEELNKTERELG